MPVSPFSTTNCSPEDVELSSPHQRTEELERAEVAGRGEYRSGGQETQTSDGRRHPPKKM